jgi:hypothetical protein
LGKELSEENRLPLPAARIIAEQDFLCTARETERRVSVKLIEKSSVNSVKSSKFD